MEIRASVRENVLSEPSSVTAADYRSFIEKSCCWVCHDEEVVTGFAALNAEAASVWALFVDPRFEGRGIGRALLGCVVAKGRELGHRRLTLLTEPGSRAEAFYRRAGWSSLGTDEKGELRMELIL